MRGRRLLWAAAFLAFCGGILLGIGTACYAGRSLALQTVSPEERDRRNARIAENVRYVSMEQELSFDDTDEGYAGIANAAESSLGCRVELIRDATGEVLYRSGLIDPGCYIEKIRLNTALRRGYYPCTALWSFYERGTDTYLGNMGFKVTVIRK